MCSTLIKVWKFKKELEFSFSPYARMKMYPWRCLVSLESVIFFIECVFFYEWLIPFSLIFLEFFSALSLCSLHACAPDCFKRESVFLKNSTTYTIILSWLRFTADGCGKRPLYKVLVEPLTLNWILISMVNNRPFYSCLLSDLAFEWQRGWSWPCFDTDLIAFVV